MKVIAFAARPDEQMAFDKFSKKFGMVLELVPSNLSEETVEITRGFDMVSIVGNCTVNRSVLEKLSQFGIKYIASRSTGYDNVDLESAKEFGINVSNTFYSPNSVGEFAVMSALTLLRNIPYSFRKVEKNNFSLKGLQGRELRNQVVGVIGTGKIGRSAIKGFSGFGCKIIAYDPYPSDEVKDLVTYVTLEELLGKADLITLHVPLTDDNKYMIGEESISKMKDEVLIINTSRGELVNTRALINALRSGKIAGAALDVIEGERGILHNDCSEKPLAHDELAILKSMPNVQITGHHAFYTRQAVSDMVEFALTNLNSFYNTGDAPNALLKA